MYVCNCHGVRESEVSTTIRNGATTLRALREQLGVGTCCGKCVCDVRKQLERELTEDRDCGSCAGSCGRSQPAETSGSMALC